MAGIWENIAAVQHGLLSRKQATEVGLTRRQIDGLLSRGSWVRVHPRVYRASAAPESWRQRLMGAYLWSNGRAAIFGRSAAALWEFEGYWRTYVEICSQAELTPPTGVVFHRIRRVMAADTRILAGMRVTTVARTILDLTSIVPPRTLERTLDCALRKGQVTLDALVGCIRRNGRRGREGITHLEALLSERRGQRDPDSPLESDVAAAIREYGISAPVKRYCVIEADYRIAEVDLAWPKQKVAVQVHGSSFHRQPRTWENDQLVENALQIHGWLVVKVTRRMFNEAPQEILALVARALARRGSA